MKVYKNKSVLLVGWFFYPKLGGVESIILNIAKELVRKGFRVGVLTSASDGLPQKEDLDGFTIFRRKIIDSQNKISERDLEREFNEILDEVVPEVIHFHNGSYPAASSDMVSGAHNVVRMFKIAKSRNIKVIEHAHNAQLKNPDQTAVLRNLPWDGIIAVSKFVREEWIKLGVEPNKITVIYNGIDFERFHNASPNYELIKPKAEKDFVILFPARIVSMSRGEISKQKNFSLLAEAVSAIDKREARRLRLVAILNTSLKNTHTEKAYRQLNEMINRFKIRDLIEFINEIEPSSMAGVIAASDVVCVPSINETFGLVYLEAMACGKVAIASNTGGPKEYIKDGYNGYLVDPKDSEDLVQKLKIVMNNPSVCSAIAKRAKSTARKYEFKKFVEEVADFYYHLMM